MRLAQMAKIVPILEPEDHNAGVDGDSVCMKDYSHAAFILLFGELTGNAVLKVYEGATAGAKTTAIAFNYRITSVDLKTALADALGAEAAAVAASGLTLTAATYEDRMVVVEISDRELSDGFPWITLELSSAASELFASIVAVLGMASYPKDVPPTAIT